MFTSKDLFIDIITVIWWIGLWNCIDLLIVNHSSGYNGAIEHPLFEYMKDFVWKYYYSDRYVTTKISVPELVDDILKMKYIHAF